MRPPLPRLGSREAQGWAVTCPRSDLDSRAEIRTRIQLLPPSCRGAAGGRQGDLSSAWRVEEGNRSSEPRFLPVPDTTDFQESFVTSGVFSVTELIQVSRSECPRPPCAGIRRGRDPHRGGALEKEKGLWGGHGSERERVLRERRGAHHPAPLPCHQAKVPREGGIQALLEPKVRATIVLLPS